MLLAVAITNTGCDFSCIQVKKVPKTRLLVPESPPPAVQPEAFLNLIDPQNAGRRGLCQF